VVSAVISCATRSRRVAVAGKGDVRRRAEPRDIARHDVSVLRSDADEGWNHGAVVVEPRV